MHNNSIISIAWKELNFQIPEEENRMYDMQPYLQKIDQVIEEGPFQDTWESLSKYQVPDW